MKVKFVSNITIYVEIFRNSHAYIDEMKISQFYSFSDQFTLPANQEDNLSAGVCQRNSGFISMQVHVRFVVERVVVRQAFIRARRLSRGIIILPLLHTFSFFYYVKQLTASLSDTLQHTRRTDA